MLYQDVTVESLNRDRIELLKECRNCQICSRQFVATKIAQNDLNGIKLRICDACFNSWASRCKISVIYEFQQIDERLEQSPDLSRL